MSRYQPAHAPRRRCRHPHRDTRPRRPHQQRTGHHLAPHRCQAPTRPVTNKYGTVRHVSAIMGYAVIMTETAGTPRRGAPIRYPELHDPAWLQAAVDQGLTRTDIAAKLGSTRHTVSAALSRHRISAGTPGRPAVHPQLHDPAWLAAAVERGLTQNDIADRVGCHQSAVSRALHRHNIRRRENP